MLERVVNQIAALAIVESRHRPLETFGAEARLGEAAKCAARLRSQRRYAARALSDAKRGRDFVGELLEHGLGLQKRMPVRPRQRRRSRCGNGGQKRTRCGRTAVAGIRIAEHALRGARSPSALHLEREL